MVKAYLTPMMVCISTRSGCTFQRETARHSRQINISGEVSLGASTSFYGMKEGKVNFGNPVSLALRTCALFQWQLFSRLELRFPGRPLIFSEALIFLVSRS